MKNQAPKKHHQIIMLDGRKVYDPYCEDAKKKIDEYKVNQIVHFNPVGQTDWRSVRQIGLYFQACKFVTDRVDHINCTSYTKTDVFTRGECDMYDDENSIKDFRGNVLYAPMLSIAFHNMKHLKATGYFKDAYGFMSGLTPGYGFDTEKFINDVKSSCKGGK